MICRHEIIFHNQFKISLFDVMHHYRPNVTMSYNIGPKVSYSNKTQLSTELIVTVDESVDGCTVDDLSQLFNLQYSIIDEPIDKTNPNKDVDTECNMENNKDDENNDIIEQCFNFESEESTAMNNIDSLSQEQSQNQHDYLPTKSIQSISNEIYNYYNRSDAYTKQCISSMLLKIRDMAKCYTYIIDIVVLYYTVKLVVLMEPVPLILLLPIYIKGLNRLNVCENKE